jgi:hypothetical protein
MEDETHLDAFLGFLEVDDVPDRVQVLQSPTNKCERTCKVFPENKAMKEMRAGKK